MPATDDLCRSWLDLAWHFNPAEGSAAGVAAADARLGRFDRDTVREHLAAARAIAGAVEELEVEEMADEIDRTALLGEIRGHLARFEDDQPHTRNPVFWLDHLARALAGPAPDRDLHPRLAAVPDFLAAARDTLRKPSVVLRDAAIEMIPGLVSLVHDVARRTAAAGTVDETEAAGLATEAEAALARLRLALAHELGPDEDPHAAAIGETRYGWILHHQHMLRQSAGEAWRWGNAEADRIEAEIIRLAAEIDPGRPWRDVYESVRDEGLVTGDLRTAVEAALGQARESSLRARLLEEREGELRIEEAPAALAVLMPLMEYRPPAGAEPGTILLAAPTAPEDHEAAAWDRGEHDRHRLAVLAAHEGWPGRHAQALAAADAASAVRRSLQAPIAVAGWGCHAEVLLAEHGGLHDAADRLAQQVLSLLRALRLVVDSGIHTSQLTPGAAEELLLERVPVDRHAARAEVRRCCAVPGLGGAYALGLREYTTLRRDWEQSGRGGTLADFHEAVLSHGRIPPTLVRWGLAID